MTTSMVSDDDEVSRLWRVASNLLDQCSTVMAEAREFWTDIAARFDDPMLDQPNILPELRVDFAVAQLSIFMFFERAKGYMTVLNELLEHGRNANDASYSIVKALRAAPKAMPLKSLFIPMDDLHSLISDLKVIPEERQMILVNASNAIIAVTTPWYFIRGAFAVYLNKPTLGGNTYALIVTLLKEGVLHEVSKQIPFIGTIIAIAEMIKKQEEGGYSDFLTFIKQYNAYVGLKNAVERGLDELGASEQGIREYHNSIKTVNIPFLERAQRITAFIESEPLV